MRLRRLARLSRLQPLGGPGALHPRLHHSRACNDHHRLIFRSKAYPSGHYGSRWVDALTSGDRQLLDVPPCPTEAPSLSKCC